MTLDQFQRYQEQTFDAFCKAVIRNEAINAHRKIAAQADKEVSLTSLSTTDFSSLRYEDSYCPYCKTYYVKGTPVHIYDEPLGEALQYLVPQRRDIILLCFFLDYSDTEIARLLQITNPTVKNRRIAALKRLKELMEAMGEC